MDVLWLREVNEATSEVSVKIGLDSPINFSHCLYDVITWLDKEIVKCYCYGDFISGVSKYSDIESFDKSSSL